MRKLLLFLFLLGAGLLRAEIPATTFTFSNPEKTDKGTNWDGQEGWTNLFASKACKARTNGIGIAPRSATGGQSGMVYSFAEGDEETIAQISVTCMASFKGTADAAKFHTLGVRIDGTLMTESFSFDGAVDSPVTLTFKLEAPAAVQSIWITNETDQAGNDSLFEINTVSWQAEFPGIQACFSAPSGVNYITPIHAAVTSITGGTGEYVDTFFTFNDVIVRVEGLEVAVFDAPMTDGIYPLTLTVVDSAGNMKTFTQDIRVTLYLEPMNLEASNILRDGFDLSWTQHAQGAITFYRAEVYPNPRSISTPELSPEWEACDSGWQLAEPIDPEEYLNGLPLATLTLLCSNWEGDLQYSTDGGTVWRSMYKLSGRRIFSDLSGETAPLLLRTEEEPPASFSLAFVLDRITSQTLPATGGAHRLTFTGLPAGCACTVYVHAGYSKDDGGTHQTASDQLDVQLLPLPGFASVSVYDRFATKMLTLVWPEDEDVSLKGKLRIHATRRAVLKPGLYLSRVYFTKKTDACDALSSGKAVVITNTSDRPVALDGTYALRASRPRREDEIAEGKTDPLVYTWDFGVKDTEGVTVYPYELPAGGELLFYSGTLLEEREGICATTAQAVRNLTPEYTMSLLQAGAERNALIPEENAIVRLREDSKETLQTTALENETRTLEALYDPWGKTLKTVLLDELTLRYGGGPAQIDFSDYVCNVEAYTAVYATCYLVDGSSRSAATTVTLYEYEPPEAVLKPGFQLRLR